MNIPYHLAGELYCPATEGRAKGQQVLGSAFINYITETKKGEERPFAQRSV